MRDDAKRTRKSELKRKTMSEKKSNLIPIHNQRLFDLVRHQRLELFQQALITEREYEWLATCGPDSARRLEDYDSLRAENERLKTMMDEMR